MTQSVLPAFGLKEEKLRVESYGSGLINHTWKVIVGEHEYILQRVNQEVFKEPVYIAHNTKLIGQYLKSLHPEYKFVGPLLSNEGAEMVHFNGEGFFRLFPFVEGSHSIDVVKTPEQAKEAAIQFGRFTRLLSGLDVGKLKVTIPHFHDLTLRYQQFLQSLQNGDKMRIKESEGLIKTLKGYNDIVETYEGIKLNHEFKLRVTHHDTKISNVLFNEEGKGICVIDLDTVMPGYFISDVGDMMRTYLSPVSEEECDLDKIEVREDFYKAIAEGYLSEMKDELSDAEKSSFIYAGKFMIYMQALRFLTDHLMSDQYYGARYPGHNLVRAKNQTALLKRLIEKEKYLTPF